MPRDLRQLVKVANRLAAGFAELQNCIAAMGGAGVCRVHAERVAVYSRCFTLAMHLGKDATCKTFAARHSLTRE